MFISQQITKYCFKWLTRPPLQNILLEEMHHNVGLWDVRTRFWLLYSTAFPLHSPKLATCTVVILESTLKANLGQNHFKRKYIYSVHGVTGSMLSTSEINISPTWWTLNSQKHGEDNQYTSHNALFPMEHFVQVVIWGKSDESYLNTVVTQATI